MADLFDLAATISVNSSQADRALDRNQKRVQQLTEEYKKLDKQVTSVSGGSGGLYSKLSKEMGLDKLKTDMSALTQQSAGLNTELAASAAQFSAAAGFAQIYIVALIANAAAVVALHKVMVDLSVDMAKQATEISALAQKHKVSSGTMQAAMLLAAETGKSLTDVLKDQGKEVDAAREKYQKMGAIMGQDTVNAGVRLNVALVELSAQWTAMGNAAAAAITPALITTLTNLNALLKDLGPAASAAAMGIGVLAGYMRGQLVAAISIVMTQLAPLIAAMRYIDSWKPKATQQQGGDGIRLLNEVGEAWRKSNATLPRWNPFARAGGGGGGGRGGGAAQTDPGVQLLKQLEEQFRNLTPRTELQRVQDKLLEEQYAKTTDTLKKRIMIVAIEIDMQKKILAQTRERIATGIEEREEFQKFVDLVQQSLTRRRTMSDVTGLPFFDLGGGSVYGADGSTRPRTMAAGATRPRIATVEEQVLREQIAMHRQRMQALAADLTSTLDRAIYDGFSQGAARGFATLAQGLLDIVNRIFLARLEEGLTNLLSGLGGSSGSIWGKILNIGVGVIGAGIGGGSFTKGGISGGTLGKYADGGFMSPYSWGIVGERGPELVRAGSQGATVTPNVGGNIYVTVYANDARSFNSRDTQAQITRKMRQLQQKQALTG